MKYAATRATHIGSNVAHLVPAMWNGEGRVPPGWSAPVGVEEEPNDGRVCLFADDDFAADQDDFADALNALPNDWERVQTPPRTIILCGQSNAVRCVPPDLSAYDVTIVKSARDSSSITRWLPGGSERAGMYAAVAGTEVLEFWFIQGEEDARLVELAEVYESRLIALIEDVRTTLGNPSLLVRIALLNSNCGRTYTATVRAAHVAVCAADAHAEPFDMNAIPGYDRLHYSTAGNIASGAGLGAAFIATQ